MWFVCTMLPGAMFTGEELAEMVVLEMVVEPSTGSVITEVAVQLATVTMTTTLRRPHSGATTPTRVMSIQWSAMYSSTFAP